MNDIFKFTSFSSNLFILLLGFVFGNLFPTFCGEFLGKAYILILISLESFNYFYYAKVQLSSPRNDSISKDILKTGERKVESKKQKQPFSWFLFDKNRTKKPLKSLQNSFKLGFLFGLFVDAFKVGS